MVSGQLGYLAAQEHNEQLLRVAERERLFRSTRVSRRAPDEETPHSRSRLSVWWQAHVHLAAAAR